MGEVKKIAHLIFSMQGGGAENLLVDMANTQVRHSSVAVMIVNDQYDKTVTERLSGDIQVKYVGRQQGSPNPIPVVKIWQWLWNYNPDIIHCHHHKLIRLLPFWRHKAVMTVHNVGIPIGNLRKYKKLFSISFAVQQDLLNRGGLSSSVIYNGISFQHIRQKKSYIFKKSEAYKIVQVGRLQHDKKGQDVTMKALKMLHHLGYSNISLYCIGDGPSKSYLEDLARELEIENSVYFLGAVQRTWIYENLSQFDLLVQPSLYEGFGLAIVEGIAAGLPVIASKVDGPAEILKDAPSGFLFDPGNLEAFVESAKTVVGLTRQNRISELCSDSYKKFYQKYSINNTATEYLKQYSTLNPQ